MKNNLMSYLARLLFFICYGLSRWRVSGAKHLEDLIKTNRPTLVCIWHGRSVFGAYYMKKNKYSVYAIAGRHNDAEIIATVFKKWGFGLIRGSSTRGGGNVINEMKNKFKNGDIVCITSDGPRGPIHVAKKGAIITAMERGVTIIPMTGIASSYWKFKSWDKFILPKPFSTIYLTIGSKIDYNIQDITIKEGSKIVTDVLNKLQTGGDSKVS